MAFNDDIDPAPVHPVVVRAVNEHSGTYFVKIAMKDKPEAGRFLRELWESIGGCVPKDDDDATGEWTDRARDFRTTYSNWDQTVFIRTHAWSPSGDRKTLHADVLAFLRGRGLVV